MSVLVDEGLLAPAGDLRTHLDRHGPLPAHGTGLVDELARAGLTGRGGAGFPTHRKLAAMGRGRGVVIANGAEGEPASAKDRTLLTCAPHLVLDGLAAAVAAVGAGRAVVYAHPQVADQVRRAVAERADPVPLEVVTAGGGFLDGEASAVVAAVEGRPAIPGDKARRLVERARPALVQNVETLAHVARIARGGADWFRCAGTPDEPGTMLTTVGSGRVREVPLGTPIAAVLGGPVAGPVLVGGYHGAWLAPGEVATATLSRISLRPFGASPGAGVLLALPRGVCGLVRTAEITGYLARASARQCGPCRFGLPALADVLDRIARRDRTPELVARTAELAALVEGRGACHHPDGTARLVRSALRVFAADVDAHLHGHCLADDHGPAGGTR